MNTLKTVLPQTLAWTGHTDRGRVRTNNEDAFLCLEAAARDVRLLGKVGQARLAEAQYLFGVSDGMGGAMAGEFASRIAVERITRLMPEVCRRQAGGHSIEPASILQRLFAEIHRALLYLGDCYEECRGMGTTLTLAWVVQGHLHYAHIGDSRIYHLPGTGAGIRQLSHDDTHVGWLFRTGKINERQAKTHPGRNSLQRALGAGNQFVDPQVGTIPLDAQDKLLLCTDGLTEGLFDEQLEQLIRAPSLGEQQKLPANRLVQASVERSGCDNTTAVVVEFE